MNNLVVSGKRKTSVAKATIVEGNGKVLINKRPISVFPKLQQLEIYEPIILAKQILGKIHFDIFVNVKGGGISSQVDAARLTIAKAIVAFTKNDDVRNNFLAYDRTLLVADTRRKEARKPGDSKARARRQTSYR